MVSLQFSDSPWLATSEESGVPDDSHYIAPFRSNEPSYTTELSLAEPLVPDTELYDTLLPYQNSFFDLYFNNPLFGVNDSYTIFYPLSTTIIDQLHTVKKNTSMGFSYKDSKFNTDSSSKLESLLKRHLVSIQINPRQIEYRNTRITMMSGETIDIDQDGMIHGDNRIRQYIKKNNVSVFFIDKEIVI